MIEHCSDLKKWLNNFGKWLSTAAKWPSSLYQWKRADKITKMTELTVAKYKMTEQCRKMADHYSRMTDKIIKWLSSIAKMVEFTVATRKWLSSLKWLSNETKIAEHCSNDVVKWLTQNSKIVNALSKWLSEPWKMTESHEVVAVRGPSARSGPHQLDRDVAWTMGHGVNAGWAGSNPRGRTWELVARAWGSVAWSMWWTTGSITLGDVYIYIYI
jgi:hypothetical protein